jgi:hypothetical protein
MAVAVVAVNIEACVVISIPVVALGIVALEIIALIVDGYINRYARYDARQTSVAHPIECPLQSGVATSAEIADVLAHAGQSATPHSLDATGGPITQRANGSHLVCNETGDVRADILREKIGAFF